ncbi:hypothetical protein [Actinoplanes sp. NPDC051411]|uniref:MmyB family transcriptional regulator n=1 Tax=Actinoplanes sp. NPDC051411 TaxID=3155522 RepID=UPI003420B0F4
MTDSQRAARLAQAGALCRACRMRLDPDDFPRAEATHGGPRKQPRKTHFVTQRQIADRLGYSPGWYGDFERGKVEQWGVDFLRIVAWTLKMTAEETNLLYSLALLPPGEPEEELRDSRIIKWILDEQSCPAAVFASSRRLLAFNKPMLEWFPWAGSDNANFMRWAFTTIEARTMLHNWPTEWGPQLWAELQYSLARQPENTELTDLKSEILERSRAARDFDENPVSYIAPDGQRRRVKLPAHDNKIITIELRVLVPQSAPASTVTWFVPLDENQH